MTTFLINIIATSNLAQVLAKDNAALEANSMALDANSGALTLNSVASNRVARSKRGLVQQTTNATSAVGKATQSIRNMIVKLFGLDEAVSRVGYNIMGFSFRVGQWFVPAMIIMASSMLPVIMGLLAIGTAAIVASGGVLGFMALGAAMMSHRMNKQNANGGGYGGARRPYSGGGSGGSTKTVWDVLLEPVWQVLEQPKFKGAVDNAVLFVQATFGGLAAALAGFMSNVDPGMIGMIEEMFLTWLPKAGKSLAVWGSQLLQLIGSGSMERLNKLMGYLGQAIMNAADWLANGGGWEQLDEFGSIVADVASTFLILGKSAFPILLQVLRKIYPFPIKPFILAIAELLTTISQNDILMAIIGIVAQAIVLFIILKVTLLSLASVLFGATARFLMARAAIIGLAYMIGYAATAATAIFLSFFAFIRKSIVAAFMLALQEILGLVGLDLPAWLSKYTEIPDPGKVLTGEYGGYMYRSAKRQEAGAQALYDVGRAGAGAIEVFFHPDGAVVDSAVRQSVYEKTGSFESVNNKLTGAGQRKVSL